MSQAVFAQWADVSLSTLQYWIYKLRRQSTALVPTAPALAEVPRLLPVVVDAERADEPKALVEIDVSDVRMRLSGRPDPTYVAALVGALRAQAC